VDRLLERLRLGHLAQAHPYTLSGGEQRRLSVATALATAPRVLVLDEPTFGQDRTTWTELAALIAAHVEAGGAAVSVTHDEDFVRVLGDRRLHLTRDGAAEVAA
jgi:energy-coupling factor transport system ATP-binding protein